MGCCFSRTQGPNSPNPGPISSVQAVNPPSSRAATQLPATSALTRHRTAGTRTSSLSRPSIDLPPPAIDTDTPFSALLATTNTSQQHQRQRQPITRLDQYLNRPLRRHVWTASKAKNHGAESGSVGSSGGVQGEKRKWTRESIDAYRTEFFETRVSGRDEIWLALRRIVEALWEEDLARARRGDGGGSAAAVTRHDKGNTHTEQQPEHDAANIKHEPINTEAELAAAVSAEIAAAAAAEAQGSPQVDDTGLATAQAFLDAAQISLPTGNLADGCYDMTGRYYPLPEAIVSDPTDLASRSSSSSIEAAAAAAADGVVAARDSHSSTSPLRAHDPGETHGDNGDDGSYPTKEQDTYANYDDNDNVTNEDEDQKLRRREEKGKAVLNPADYVTVTVRLSDRSRDLRLKVTKDGAGRNILRLVREECNLPPTYKIKLALLGKIIADSDSTTTTTTIAASAKHAKTLQDLGWAPGLVIQVFLLGLGTGVSLK